MTKTEVKQILNLLYAIYSYLQDKMKSKQRDDLLIIWHAVLEDLDAELVRQAVKHYCSSDEKYHPTPGQIRQLAFDLIESKSDIPCPEEAFGQCLKAMSWTKEQRKRYDVHPLVEQAIVAMGGWHRLGQESVEMVASLRARFISCYKTLLNRQRQQVRMLPSVRETLDGLPEGEPERARALIEKTVEALK